jgi:hypothetical protein
MGALQRTSPSNNTLSEHWNRWGAMLGQIRSNQQGYLGSMGKCVDRGLIFLEKIGWLRGNWQTAENLSH